MIPTWSKCSSDSDLRGDRPEEIAALTELNRATNTAKYYLLDAGHCVNAAVEPEKLLQPEASPKVVRVFQMQNADLAFTLAFGATAALTAPDRFGLLTTGERPS